MKSKMVSESKEKPVEQFKENIVSIILEKRLPFGAYMTISCRMQLQIRAIFLIFLNQRFYFDKYVRVSSGIHFYQSKIESCSINFFFT